MLKKMITMLIVVSMLMSCLFQTAAAAPQQEAGQFSDIGGHWAAGNIEKWTEKGLVQGYPDGTFKPEGLVTRAEFCALVNRVFGFSGKSTQNYADVLPGKWYADIAAVARAEGYTEGWIEEDFEGDAPIKRDEAALAMFNAFRLSPVNTGEYLAGFTDMKDYHGAAKEAIAALTAGSVVAGYPDKSFRPEANVTRAESIKLLDNITGELFTSAGSFTGITVEGNAVVNTTGVTLKDSVITGNLYLAEGIGEGDAVLDNVKVSGKTFITGGGANSVHVNDSELADVILDKHDGVIRIYADGSSIDNLLFLSGGSYDEKNPAGGKKADIVIDSDTPAGQVIEIHGNIDTLVCNAPGVIIKIAEGATVNSLSISSGADGVVLTVDGKVASADIDAGNVKVNGSPVQAGTTMPISSSTNRPSSGGGSGSGPSQPQAEKAAAPGFSPIPGTYAAAQTVAISSATEGATIRYTLDGSAPIQSSAVYGAPITVSETATIKAYASKAGMSDSDVATAVYIISIPQPEKVETPVFSPPEGVYETAQAVTISSATTGAAIRYTTDGSAPDGTSPLYDGPITVAESSVIRAYAVKEGLADSNIATAVYTINPLPPGKVAMPVFTPPGGTYDAPQLVALSSTTTGTAIRYTTDGSTPDGTSLLYDGPLTVAESSVIKAYAAKEGLVDSDVSTAVYTIEIPAPEETAAPVFSPPGGTYDAPQSITISSATTNAVIRYTTDGNTPDGDSLLYNGPITVSESTTLKAYAAKAGMSDSAVTAAVYIINPPPTEKVETPFFSPIGGVYSTAQTVTITTVTTDAAIRYTTDGTAPNASSTVYEGPVTVSATATLKAYAFKAGMLDSDIASAKYTISSAPVNIALNRPAAASTSLGDNKPGEAFDGETGSRWESVQGADPQWISVDIGASFVTGVKLSWETAAGKEYKIQVSNDNQEWNDAYTKTNGTSGATENITFDSPKSAEYVRMYGTSRTTAYGYSLWEFEVYGTTDASKVQKPLIAPAAGTYTSRVTVSMSAPTPGSAIKYTTDGSAPTDTNGTLYSGPFTLTSTATVKAIAYKAGMNNSNVAASVFTVQPLGTPSGLIKSSSADTSVTLAWNAVTGATGYNLYRSASSEGPYEKLAASPIAVTRYTDTGLTPDTTYYYKVSAINAAEESPMSAALAAVTVPTTEPDFGKNVIIFDPSMPMADISNTCVSIFNQMERNQFGSERYAILFKPGTYTLTQTLRVGFYTQVSGLGQSPDDVVIGGARLGVDAGWMSGNATQNFWRSAENLSVAGDTKWAVSQAAPLRRVHIKGNLRLADGGWSSGGFLADSKVDGNVSPESQQQWLSRNSTWGSWGGGVWNMVFVGDNNTPTGTYPTSPFTVVDRTPAVMEKPFLYVDAAGEYKVFVPDLQYDTKGITWTNGLPQGESIPIEQFYITHPETDTAATINAELAQGKHLLFTPGVYHLSDTIRVNNPDTVVLGLGFPTLIPDNGIKALQLADVDGIKVAGLLFDAGTVNSPVVMEVGPSGSSNDHSANPIILSDLFFRVGGTTVGKADVCLTINSDDVICDYMWIWRADHGSGVGWDVNTTKNGLIVNGDDVTIYGLMVEHFHEYETIWNGNGGRTYFYQNECPYDVPNQASWMNGSVNGYASYKVADTVTSHETWGFGMYSNFDRGVPVKLESAIEAPVNPNVRFHNTCTVFLSGSGEITHVINNSGAAAKAGSIRQTITEYPADYLPIAAKPAFSPAAGTYESVQNVTITSATSGATIRYTTNGSTPNASSAVYNGPISISATTTLKAYAAKAGMRDSEVAAAVYTINLLPPGKAAAPVLNPPGGTYVTAQSVSMTTATTGAAIRYTIDGSAPGASSTLYSAPITISESATVKAYAIKEGMTDSNVTTEAYNIEPDFGPNVIIFDPTMPIADISNTCVSIFNQMERNQFGGERYAILFKPGTYNLTQTLRIGFYTQVAGLGQSPDNVVIGGERLGVDAGWMSGNATQNFWRSAENLSVAGDTKWAVSQAAPLRRVHIKGNLRLADGGWSSGGFLADSVIDGNVSPESQQQWLSRNSTWGSWNGGVWNMVFVGDNNTPTGTYPASPFTVVDRTPAVMEKPFLYIDAAGKYKVFVPDLQYNTKGITWANGLPQGESIPIEQFYIAHQGTDTAATINAALAQGKHLLFTPGVYHLNDTIRVNNPDTVVYGLGFPTLIPDNGIKALQLADVDGIKVSGLLFDAGTVNSSAVMEVGPSGSSNDHSANPIFLSDLFFRVGGTTVGKADVCLTINSDDVICDYTWIWRADHGSGVGWDENTTKNGLIVNGDDVTIYGLMVEHFHEYQTIWNGNGGRTYFYQNECPYDVPNQASWMNGSVNGYTSYKVADTVTSHETWGFGMYSNFDQGVPVKLESAIEAPVNPNVKFHNTCTVFLSGSGEITHIINDTGAAAKAGSIRQTLKEYPPSGIPEVEAPVFSPAPGVYTSAQTVTINCATGGATIKYTTNGTDPGAGSPTYTTTLAIASTTTIRAYAFKEGMTDSPMASATYTINLPQPTNALYPGNTAVTNVTPAGLNLQDTAPTTGGWTPTKTVNTTPLYWYGPAQSGSYAAGNWSFILWSNKPASASVVEVSLYRVNADGSGATQIGSPQTIDVMASGGGNHTSTFNFAGLPSVSFNNQRLALKIVKASGADCTMAYRTQDFPTRLLTPVFSAADKAAAPVFTPAGGTFTSAQTVAMSTTTTGAAIRYTIDGSTPTAASALYGTPISISATTTVKAYAVKAGIADSDVTTAVYTINLPPSGKVAAPVFTPAGGVYDSAQTVTIGTTTTGAAIRYTTNGSTPTASSALYSTPISVPATATLKAYATKTGMNDSDVATAVYTINLPPSGKVAAPVFTPAGGVYDSAQTVAISTTTTGTAIRYTTNGSTPTASSTLYSAPISIPATATLKAYATKTGMTDSDVTTAVYTINPQSGDPWTLVWSDEFDGAAVDTSKWNMENKGDGFGNNEAQYYRPDNAVIEDGKLVIKAKKENFGGRSYTSAKLFTQAKGEWKYGRFEASIKLPLGQGFWPAFWMMPADNVYGGWAASGEVDIMEAKGRIPDIAGGTLHYGGAWPNNRYTSANYTFPQGQSIAGFHTYAIEWEPGEYRWYVDGNLYQTQNDWNTRGANGEEKFSFPAPFDQDFYLILNLAIGGNFDGNLLPPDTAFPAQMEVEYVKVYTLTGRPYKTPSEPGAALEPLPPGARQPDGTGNLVKDVNFEQGINDNPGGADANFGERWNYVHNADFNGAAEVSIDALGGRNYAKVNVTNRGTQPYSVQLEQLTTLGKGRWYKYSFDAKADKNRTLNTKLGGGGGAGWSAYSESYTVNLTTQSQHFERVFQMAMNSDILTRIEFNCATDTGPVWIGNVRVEEIPASQVDYASPKAPLPTTGNHIYNGAFDKYTIDRMAYWNVTTAGAVALVSVPESTRELTVDITDGGTAPGAVTVDQRGVQLLSGESYILTFTASAAANRGITVKLLSKDGTAVYGSQEFNLTTGRQTYEAIFKMETASDTEARLAFLLGGSSSDVRIDNVLLVTTDIDYGDIDNYPLKNGDFSQALTNWETYAIEGGAATFAVVNGEARVTVTGVGSANYCVMLNQGNMALLRGKEYELSFDARASVARDFEATVENSAYTRVFQTYSQQLTTSMQHFTFTFTPETSEVRALKFLLGNTAHYAAGSVYIDNVVLKVKDAS